MKKTKDEHVHSPYLAFNEKVVKCSKLCGQSTPVDHSLALELSGAHLEVVDGAFLPNHQGVIYVVTVNGNYWCTVTGYTRGVLHLSDFSSKGNFDLFKATVSKCFGVLLVQIDDLKEKSYEESEDSN